jgi:hypothetical protein
MIDYLQISARASVRAGWPQAPGSVFRPADAMITRPVASGLGQKVKKWSNNGPDIRLKVNFRPNVSGATVRFGQLTGVARRGRGEHRAPPPDAAWTPRVPAPSRIGTVGAHRPGEEPHA